MYWVHTCHVISAPPFSGLGMPEPHPPACCLDNLDDADSLTALIIVWATRYPFGTCTVLIPCLTPSINPVNYVELYKRKRHANKSTFCICVCGQSSIVNGFVSQWFCMYILTVAVPLAGWYYQKVAGIFFIKLHTHTHTHTYTCIHTGSRVLGLRSCIVMYCLSFNLFRID